MKYPEIKVNIPEPCHEDWNKMTPTEKGKFCGVCTKEVVDFSSKSDEEIVKYAVKDKSLCGRFHASQLDRKLIVDRKKRNHWLSYAASLLFPMALFSQEVKKGTANIPQITQTSNDNFKSLNIGSLHKQGKIAAVTQNDSITVKGTVVDEDGLSLPGATVEIKNKNIGIITDFDGNYSIKVKKGDVLVFSYVGFANTEIKVNENRSDYNVILVYDIKFEVMTIGMICFSHEQGADEYGYVSKYDKTYYPKPMNEEEIKIRDERIHNYFAFQKKKWREKREKRRAEREKRKAEKAAKRLAQ